MHLFIKDLKIKLLSVLLWSIVACNPITEPSTDNERDLYLQDFINFDQIEKIRIYNHKPEHELEQKNRAAFLEHLARMKFEKGLSLKMGGTGIELMINGKEYHLSGRTKGEYWEVHRSIVTKNIDLIGEEDYLYFKVSNFNVSNY